MAFMQLSRWFKHALLLLAFATSAQAAPASEASVRALFDLSRVESQFDSVSEQVSASMDNVIRHCPACKATSPAQQEILEQMKARIMALLKSEYSFSRYEPQLIAIYRSTFSESEIQGMLRFYRSPAGHAFVRKMPLVTQQTLRISQQMVSDTAPQLQAILAETAALLKAGRVVPPVTALSPQSPADAAQAQ